MVAAVDSYHVGWSNQTNLSCGAAADECITLTAKKYMWQASEPTSKSLLFIRHYKVPWRELRGAKIWIVV